MRSDETAAMVETSVVVGHTNGHLNGYSLVAIFHSNHRETQYSQLCCMPVLTTTGPKANTETRPVDPKKAEKDLFGSASNRQGISNRGDGHDPCGAVGTQ